MTTSMPLNDRLIPIAPWLQPLWRSLNFDSLPNAILLHGQSGVGKFSFALEVAKAVLCESESLDQRPCNHCEACHWFATGNHPDFLALVPETHRKLLPHADYEGDESPKKGRASRDDDADGVEKKRRKIFQLKRLAVLSRAYPLELTEVVIELFWFIHWSFSVQIRLIPCLNRLKSLLKTPSFYCLQIGLIGCYLRSGQDVVY